MGAVLTFKLNFIDSNSAVSSKTHDMIGDFPSYEHVSMDGVLPPWQLQCIKRGRAVIRHLWCYIFAPKQRNKLSQPEFTYGRSTYLHEKPPAISRV